MSFRTDLSSRTCFGISFGIFILIFSFFALFSQGAWGETYTWIGGASGDWEVDTNWTPNGVPNAETENDTAIFNGSDDVTVTFTSDLTADNHKLRIETNLTGDTKKVTLNLAGHTVDISAQEGTLFANSSLIITGGGTLKADQIDCPNTGFHTIDIKGGSTLYGKRIWANKEGITLKSSDETGVLYTPLGGSYVKYVEDFDDSNPSTNYDAYKKVNFDASLTLKRDETVSYYNATVTRGTPSNTDPFATIKLSRDDGGSSHNIGTNTIPFPYKIDFKNSNATSTTYKLGDDLATATEITFSEATKTVEGYFKWVNGATNKIEISNADFSSFALGDGFSIKVYSPDKSFVLLEYEYRKGINYWTGAVNSEWSEGGNWTEGSAPGRGSYVTIYSGYNEDNPPTITNATASGISSSDTDVAYMRIFLKPQTELLMTGGELLANIIVCDGNAKFTATGGEVQILGDDIGGGTRYFLREDIENSFKFNDLKLNSNDTSNTFLDASIVCENKLEHATESRSPAVISNGVTIKAKSFSGDGKYILSDTGSGTTKLVCTGSTDTAIPGEVKLGDGGSGLIEIASENSAKFELSNIKTSGTPKIQTSGDITLKTDTGLEFSSINIDSGSLSLIGGGVDVYTCGTFSMPSDSDLSLEDCQLHIDAGTKDVVGRNLTLKHGEIFSNRKLTFDFVSVGVSSKGAGNSVHHLYEYNATSTKVDFEAKKVSIASGSTFEVANNNDGLGFFILGNDTGDASTINGTLNVSCELKVNNGKTLTVEGDGAVVLKEKFINDNTTSGKVLIKKLVLDPQVPAGFSPPTLSFGSGISVGTLIADGTSDSSGTGAGDGLGGKTITFKGKITVTSGFNFSGTSATSKLTLTGSDALGTPNSKWQIDVSGATGKKIAKFLTVENSKSIGDLPTVPPTPSTITAACSEGVKDSSTGDSTTENWIFANEWEWTGATDTDWFEAGNWKIIEGIDDSGNPSYITVSSGAYPGYSNGDSSETVLIPYLEEIGGTTPKYPIYKIDSSVTPLVPPVEISSLTIDVGENPTTADEQRATLTLDGDKNLKITGKKEIQVGTPPSTEIAPDFTNKGTLIIASNDSRIVIDFDVGVEKPINDIYNNGTVQYGDGTTKSLSVTNFNTGNGDDDVDYANLIVAEGCTATFPDEKIVVSGDLTNSGEASQTASGKLILKGDFTNKNTTSEKLKFDTLVLNPTDDTQNLDLGGGVETKNLIADGSSDGSGSGLEGKTVTFTGEITVTEKLVLKGKSPDPSEILTLDVTDSTGTSKWSIKTSDSSTFVVENKFLYVKNSKSLDTSGSNKDIVASCSFGEDSENWIFDNSWIWGGGVSGSETDWFTGSNWKVVVDETTTPVTTEEIKNNDWFPGCQYSTSENDKVLIPDSLTYYPLYTRTSSDDELSIASLKIGVGILSDASLTLDGKKNLKILGEKEIGTPPSTETVPDLTIFGTLIITSDDSRIVADFDDGLGGTVEKPINDTLNYGTVQYGDGTHTLASALEITDFYTGDDDLDYANLVVAKNSDAKLPDAKIIVNVFENKGKLTQDALSPSSDPSLNIIKSFTDKTNNLAQYKKIVIVGKAETVGSDTVRKAVMIGAENENESGPKIKSLTNDSALASGEDYQEILFDGYFTITDGQTPDGGAFLFSGDDRVSGSEIKLNIGAGTTGPAHFYVPENYAKVSGKWLYFINKYPTLSYLESASPKVEKRVYAVPENSETAYNGDFPEGWIDLEDRYIWIGLETTGSGDWTEGDNWVGGMVPPTADDVESGAETLPKEIMIVSGNQPIFENDVISRKFYVAEDMTPYINAHTLICESLEIEKKGELNVVEETPSSPAQTSTLIIRQLDVSPTPSVPSVKFGSATSSTDNAKINVSNGKLIFESESDVVVPEKIVVYLKNDIVLEGKLPDGSSSATNSTVTFTSVVYPESTDTNLPDLTIRGGDFILFGNAENDDEARIKNLVIETKDDTVTPKISAGNITFKTDSGVLIYENFTDEGKFAVLPKTAGETPFLKFAGNSTTTLQEFNQNTETKYCEIQFASGNATTGTGGVKILKDELKTEKFNLVSGNVVFDGECEVKTDVADFNGNIFVNDEIVFTNAGENVEVHVESETSISGGSGTGTKTLAVNGNVFVEMGTSTDSFDVNIPLTVSKNFVAYAGKTVIVNSGSVSTSDGDIVVLGENYDVDDKENDVGSGVEGLFAYNFAGRPCAASFDSLKPTSDFGGSYSAAIDVKKIGVALSAGKNFYANGTSLSTSNNSDWTLKICENDDATKSFAEAYNTTISRCSIEPTVAGEITILSAVENCVGAADTTNMIYNGGANGNVCGIEFFRPKILTATTKYDDVIEVSFVYDDGAPVGSETPCKIENSNGEINAALATEKIVFSLGIYEKAYSDADCKTLLTNEDVSKFYLRTKDGVTWNTDATGTSSGDAFATNRAGEHKDAVPNLKIPRATSTIYSTFKASGKSRIINYAPCSETRTGSADTGTAIFTGTIDGAAPVLIEVSTGREAHTDNPATQTDYDAHNFFELKYSESVNFKRPNADSTTTTFEYNSADATKRENIALNADFGNVGSTEGLDDGIEIKSIAKISTGRMDFGSKKADGSAHSMRRISENTVRITVAGYVDGTVTLGGTQFKNWVGYINSSTSPVSTSENPASTVSSLETSLIVDKNENEIDAVDGPVNAALDSHKLQPISIFVGGKGGTYGTWDTTLPGFAPYRSSFSEWNDWGDFKNADEYEAVGTALENSGLPYIKQFEIHIFDDEPTYDLNTDARQWFSKIGWCLEKDIYPGKEYATKDIQGGLRTSTLYEATGAFKYTTDLAENSVPSTSFATTEISNHTVSTLFQIASNRGEGNVGDRVDDLYINLSFVETHLDLKTTFKISYDTDVAPITDLAGNRLKSKTFYSVDRTPPDLTFTITPVGNKKLFFLASKPISTENFEFKANDGVTPIMSEGLAGISKSFEIVKSDGTLAPPDSGLAIDENVPAELVVKTQKTTGFILTLNKDVTYEDIVGCFVRTKAAAVGRDPLSGITNTHLSFVIDEKGNVMTVDSNQYPTRHAITDFAVNVIEPLYAYDVEHEILRKGLYGDGDYAVRDFTGSGNNMNRIFVGEDLLMQTRKESGVAGATMFMSTAPDTDKGAEKLNEYMDKDYKIWIPKIPKFPIFEKVSEYENGNFITEEAEPIADSDTLFNFNILQKTDPASKYDAWKSGDQIQFMFGLTDGSGNPVTVHHEGDGVDYPLYALRLKNPNDILSLDLWRLELADVKKQRGNITIFNNVINSNNREETTIEVDLEKEGMLNIYVMTLDGNVVKRLEHSNVTAGRHIYKWNGTNNAGDSVARSIYFVRVIADGIDETRKVLVVK